MNDKIVDVEMEWGSTSNGVLDDGTVVLSFLLDSIGSAFKGDFNDMIDSPK